jgi:hypothetical protein
MTIIKNLGASQPTPLKQKLVPRFESKRRSREVFSNRDVTHEIKLALLHLKAWLLAVVACSGSGVLVLMLGLLLPGVRALICIMPGLSTIVANAGRKFFRLGHLLLILLVLEIPRRLVLE